MASIHKTNSGTYQVKWRDDAKRQRSENFKRWTDANTRRKTIEADLLSGRYRDPRSGEVLFRQWAEEVFETKVNLRPSTLARDRTCLDSLILPHLGETRLDKVRPVDLQRLVSELVAAGYAPATVRKAAQLAGQVFEDAVRSDLIDRNPYRGVKLPALRHKEMRYLTPEELEQLVDAIGPRYGTLIQVGAYAGLRFGEASGLTLEHVDVLGASLRVTQTLTEVGGKVSIGEPKTKASRRQVAIPRFLAEELGRYIGNYPPNDEGFIFTSPEGRPLRRNNFRKRVWLPAVQESVGEPLRYHDLRHTFVAFHIAAGTHLRVLQKALGHTSIRTVLDVYGHLYEGHERAAADALDEVYRAGGVHGLFTPVPAEVVALTPNAEKVPIA